MSSEQRIIFNVLLAAKLRESMIDETSGRHSLILHINLSRERPRGCLKKGGKPVSFRLQAVDRGKHYSTSWRDKTSSKAITREK